MNHLGQGEESEGSGGVRLGCSPEAGNLAQTQAVWAYGAILASALGGWVADLFGRRKTYFVVSLLAGTLLAGTWIVAKRRLTPTDA